MQCSENQSQEYMSVHIEWHLYPIASWYLLQSDCYVMGEDRITIPPFCVTWQVASYQGSTSFPSKP